MLESRGFFAVSSPSLQDMEQDSKCPDSCCFVSVTRPSLQDAPHAFWHPVCAATHGSVHNSQDEFGGSFASSQDVDAATVFGSLSGRLDSLDRWPSSGVASVFFWRADTPTCCNSLDLLHGDLGKIGVYNGHTALFDSWTPSLRESINQA
jgi:hypothetical protein